MQTGQPLITKDLWQKVLELPLENLEGWGKAFTLAAGDGNIAKMEHLLESLEITARLWSDVLLRRTLQEVESQGAPQCPETEIEAVDGASFVVQMHAAYGDPVLRNHMKDDFPEAG